MAIKTTSLETSKLLKEAGFRQDSNFYFTVFPDGKFVVMDKVRSMAEKINIETAKECHTNEFERIYGEETRIYSAPTTDELLEELPRIISVGRWPGGISIKVLDLERCNYPDTELVEALAQFWLYLKKSNLLSGGI